MALGTRIAQGWRSDIAEAVTEMHTSDVKATLLACVDWLRTWDGTHPATVVGPHGLLAVLTVSNDVRAAFLLFGIDESNANIALLHVATVVRTDPLRLPRIPAAAWKLAQSRWEELDA